MSKKYEGLAKDIMEKVGGAGNVDTLHHCQTRLRFKLYDNSMADLDALTALDGVMKALNNGGMIQVVIGMHVAEVYEEVVKFLEPEGNGNGNAAKQETAAGSVGETKAAEPGKEPEAKEKMSV